MGWLENGRELTGCIRKVRELDGVYTESERAGWL